MWLFRIDMWQLGSNSPKVRHQESFYKKKILKNWKKTLKISFAQAQTGSRYQGYGWEIKNLEITRECFFDSLKP